MEHLDELSSFENIFSLFVVSLEIISTVVWNNSLSIYESWRHLLWDTVTNQHVEVLKLRNFSNLNKTPVFISENTVLKRGGDYSCR